MFICILAETNRSPFDLPEAESELVSGYNVEYGAIPFAYFFLAEYLNMGTMSVIFNIVFLSQRFYFFFFAGIFFMMYNIIWVRATLPRMRYDVLLEFC